MKEIFRKILLTVCVCVFLYSAFQLGCIFYEYYKIEKQSDNLVEQFVEQPDENQVIEAVNDAEFRKIDFESLLKTNSDVIGWIYIPGTKVDDPVLKGENNDTYIRTGIDKQPNHGGCIFVDEVNNGDFQDQNTILYGHRLRNGLRFNNIANYRDQQFFEEHPYVYIYLPDGSINVYKVYAICKINAYSTLYAKDINYQKYTQTILKNAIQKCEISDEEAPLIMLSTCVNATGDDRFIVSARLEKQIQR